MQLTRQKRKLDAICCFLFACLYPPLTSFSEGEVNLRVDGNLYSGLDPTLHKMLFIRLQERVTNMLEIMPQIF